MSMYICNSACLLCNESSFARLNDEAHRIMLGIKAPGKPRGFTVLPRSTSSLTLQRIRKRTARTLPLV